ncbi:Z-DNA-binding protein 1 isoform X2 [Phyllostomus hastatus]|uniref:Z-DNA-binding protein 1 isoform X2 n=1 Tax=Phyllostomus hastatus TaxID=9423 RepID=UPI001E680D47|nr:Z-DNA-binding protein 1 isoform X2 [Phyllostomus hastatus]
MAEASSDPDETDLEQKILQVLRGAGSPVRTAQLVKECQVPKKKLNQTLYRMMKESQVALAGSATWQLGGPGTGQLVSTELALVRNAERPRQLTVAVPLKPGCQLSRQQEEIYRFLKDRGPSRALVIAKSLGLKTAKEVNPDLYAMRNNHLLNYDQNSNAWAVYQPEDSRERSQATNIIYQQNPINMICQDGPNSHISIGNATAVQIGHGNSIMRPETHGDDSSTASPWLPAPAPADPSTQDPLAASWGSQDIHLEKSVLRRVQLGHDNEMSLPYVPATGPNRSRSVSGLSVSPPVSATTADPEASFEIRMPPPGPPTTEGAGGVTQRVLVKSCFLEDATIGNSNRMRIGPLGKAGPGGGAGPGDASGGSGEPAGEPAGDEAPRSEAAEPGGQAPREGPQAGPDVDTVTAHLEAMTVGSRDPEATGDSPSVD